MPLYYQIIKIKLTKKNMLVINYLNLLFLFFMTQQYSLVKRNYIMEVYRGASTTGAKILIITRHVVT